MRLIALIVSILFLSVSAANAVDAKFHAPQTEAEKALAKILFINNHDKDIVDFIWKYPERDTVIDNKFNNLFTKDLQDAWARGYKESPLGDDGIHHYIDFDFLMCGNGDSPDEFLYATVKREKNFAYISIAGLEEKDEDPLVTLYPFIMKNENGIWKLDGVHCSNGHSFSTDFHYTR